MYLFFVRVRVRGVPVLYLTNSREIELHEGMYVPNNSTFHTHPVCRMPGWCPLKRVTHIILQRLLAIIKTALS